MGLNTEGQTPLGKTKPYSYKDKIHLFMVSIVKIMEGVLDWEDRWNEAFDPQIVRKLMARFAMYKVPSLYLKWCIVL